jgi:hypothetical protein
MGESGVNPTLTLVRGFHDTNAEIYGALKW